MHALVSEQVERAALVDLQAAVTAKVNGADVEIVPVHEAVARFEAGLAAEPDVGKVLDPEQAELRRALGVA